MNSLWEEEQDAKKQRELKDAEAAEKELQKQQEKIDMDLAAKYV